MVRLFYLDSSVAIRILTLESMAAAKWFDALTETKPGALISSRLLRTEITRVLLRDDQPLERRSEILDYVSTIPLNVAILNTADLITMKLKTLDAIHLASAIASGLDPVIVTHDARMAGVASELGFTVHDPVTDDPKRSPVA